MFITAVVKKENQKERNRSEEHGVDRQKRARHFSVRNFHKVKALGLRLEQRRRLESRGREPSME